MVLMTEVPRWEDMVLASLALSPCSQAGIQFFCRRCPPPLERAMSLGSHIEQLNLVSQCTTDKCFPPLHLYSYYLHCFLYNSYGTDKENLFESQERLNLVIIFSILAT